MHLFQILFFLFFLRYTTTFLKQSKNFNEYFYQGSLQELFEKADPTNINRIPSNSVFVPDYSACNTKYAMKILNIPILSLL